MPAAWLRQRPDASALRRRYPWAMPEHAAGEVIVVGSANVDLTVRAARLPAAGETITGGIFSRQNGGKGANQAVAAARYGAATRFIGAVGDDPLADEVVDGLRAAGVATGGVARLPGTATGVALIVVDAQGENQIAVASGANGLLSGALVAQALGSVEPTPGSVCLVGFEIGDEAVMAAATWARGHDLFLVVNPAPARPLPTGLESAGADPDAQPRRGHGPDGARGRRCRGRCAAGTDRRAGRGDPGRSWRDGPRR